MAEWITIGIALLALIGSAIGFIRGASRDMDSDYTKTEHCEVMTKTNEAAHKRMGEELDKHKEQFKEGERKFSKLEKCLIFLVEKQEPGAAARMGLYE